MAIKRKQTKSNKGGGRKAPKPAKPSRAKPAPKKSGPPSRAKPQRAPAAKPKRAPVKPGKPGKVAPKRAPVKKPQPRARDKQGRFKAKPSRAKPSRAPAKRGGKKRGGGGLGGGKARGKRKGYSKYDHPETDSIIQGIPYYASMDNAIAALGELGVEKMEARAPLENMREASDLYSTIGGTAYFVIVRETDIVGRDIFVPYFIPELWEAAKPETPARASRSSKGKGSGSRFRQ